VPISAIGCKAKIYLASNGKHCMLHGLLTKRIMSNKTRSILKAIAVILVLLAVLMELKIVIIPAIAVYKFWIVVIAFGLMLVGSK
jgi:hypothetical protein